MIKRNYLKIKSDIIVPCSEPVSLFIDKDEVRASEVQCLREIVVINSKAKNSRGDCVGCLSEILEVYPVGDAVYISLIGKRIVETQYRNLFKNFSKSVFIVPACRRNTLEMEPVDFAEFKQLFFMLRDTKVLGAAFYKRSVPMIDKIESSNILSYEDLVGMLASLLSVSLILMGKRELPVDKDIDCFGYEMSEILGEIMSYKKDLLFCENSKDKLRIIRNAFKWLVTRMA